MYISMAIILFGELIVIVFEHININFCEIYHIKFVDNFIIACSWISLGPKSW